MESWTLPVRKDGLSHESGKDFWMNEQLWPE